ncbi:hypothetical protein [Bosea sp. ANAM02]|uniref:hypothetical protein n=1 Tax=Bosea sp. ANAM02 TaxID=2020412 RepID=UPI0015639FBA|nr:hypothetical protein [Bosea sp. ANAM02]
MAQQTKIARQIAALEEYIRVMTGTPVVPTAEPATAGGRRVNAAPVGGVDGSPAVVMPEKFGTGAFEARFVNEALQIVFEASGPMSFEAVMAKHPHRDFFAGDANLIYARRLVDRCVLMGWMTERDGEIRIGAWTPTLRMHPSDPKKLNRLIVEEALDIIRKEGRPLTAPELFELHPRAMELNAEGLYRLMYNRVIKGSLYSFAGAFWPSRDPLPEGYDLAMARRQGVLVVPRR